MTRLAFDDGRGTTQGACLAAAAARHAQRCPRSRYLAPAISRNLSISGLPTLPSMNGHSVA